MRQYVWHLFGGVLAGLLLWPAPGPAQAQRPNRLVIRHEGIYGADEMDWEAKRIRVTAVGTYDPDVIAGPGDKMIQAREQAELLAREKLVAMNYGVWITGYSNMNNTFTDTEARLVTAGILRDSQVDTVEFRQMDADGSILAVVTMSAPMLRPGALLQEPEKWQAMKGYVEGEIGKIKEELGYREPLEQPIARPEPVRIREKVQEVIQEDAADLRPKPQPASVETAYTGLIVDVRGVPNARVAMLPRIVDETDRRIYGVEDLPPSAAINSELVQYASSMENARRLPQAGARPLEMTALRVRPYNPGHIVVSAEDGARILGADARGKFLSRGHVVLVF